MRFFISSVILLLPLVASATFPLNNPYLVEYIDEDAADLDIRISPVSSTPNNIIKPSQNNPLDGTVAWFDLAGIAGDYRNFTANFDINIKNSSPNSISLSVCSKDGSVGMSLSNYRVDANGKSYCVGVNPVIFSPDEDVNYYLYIGLTGSIACSLASIACN